MKEEILTLDDALQSANTEDKKLVAGIFLIGSFLVTNVMTAMLAYSLIWMEISQNCASGTACVDYLISKGTFLDVVYIGVFMGATSWLLVWTLLSKRMMDRMA